MNSGIDCLHCAVDGMFRLVHKLGVSPEEQERIVKESLHYLSQIDLSMQPVAVSREIHRIIKNVVGIVDIHKDEKKCANDMMLQYLENVKIDFETKNVDTFRDLLFYAAAANIIDFGPRNHSIDFDGALACVKEKGFHIDHVAELYEKISQSEKILYLLDNAGEGVMDLRVMKYLKKHFPDLQITAVVRGAPVLNDLLKHEAEYIGIHTVADRLIENGSDAPGTLLDDITSELRNLLDTADLIISKGQGNFESLFQSPYKQLYFILMLKCKKVADLIDNAVKGDLVVYRNAGQL